MTIVSGLQIRKITIRSTKHKLMMDIRRSSTKFVVDQSCLNALFMMPRNTWAKSLCFSNSSMTFITSMLPIPTSFSFSTTLCHLNLFLTRIGLNCLGNLLWWFSYYKRSNNLFCEVPMFTTGCWVSPFCGMLGHNRKKSYNRTNRYKLKTPNLEVIVPFTNAAFIVSRYIMG